MKLVWSPETASKAYFDTIRSCENYESGVAELLSAMAAGWNAQFIVEIWWKGGVIKTSIGLAVASRHTKGRHVCIVPDEASRAEYTQAMSSAGLSPEVIVGDPEKMLLTLSGIDFLVVDCKRRVYFSLLVIAQLGNRGAVLVCKNANSRASGFMWKSVAEGAGPRRLARSVFLPVGKGLDIGHMATSEGNSSSDKPKSRWLKHVDRESGELHVIRM